ncbi:PIF1-like helicase domain containing protein [Tylopilus felleus]
MSSTLTRKQPLNPAPNNAKKRKSTNPSDADDNDKPAGHQPKQPKISAFFTPRVSLSTTCGTDKTTSVSKLSEEQRRVFDLVVEEGKNVFFTGSAGTGKSLLLRAIISALRRKYSNRPDYVAVTASTGMAASNIGGMTVHSWGAVTPGNNDTDSQIRFIRTCKPALQRWKNVKIMIIDEVSMLDGHLFNTLAELADRLRNKMNKPFGGIQLVVTGDFFQLPPVCKGEVFFAFESNAWKSCIEYTITLGKVFRQKDNHFVSLLNEIRHGTISADACKIFKSLSRPIPPPPLSMPNILPTELFPMRHEVSTANSTRLRALPHTLHTFQSHDTFPNAPGTTSTTTKKPSSSITTKPAAGPSPAPHKPTRSASAGNNKREGLLSGILAEKTLELKKGAQVMLVKNVDEMLVNGCVGQVIGFYRYREITGVSQGENDNKRTVATKTTGFVRKVKVGPDGSLLGAVDGEVGKENVKSAELKTGKGKPVSQKEGEAFPLVEFPTTEGGKEAVLVMREEFRVEDSEGKLLARRMQIPLILAWAMSIHKSQGQTIQRVKVDLGRVFEKGKTEQSAVTSLSAIKKVVQARVMSLFRGLHPWMGCKSCGLTPRRLWYIRKSSNGINHFRRLAPRPWSEHLTAVYYLICTRMHGDTLGRDPAVRRRSH